MISPAASQTGYPYDGPCGAANAAHFTVWTDAATDQSEALSAGKRLRVTVTLPAHATPPESDLQRVPPYPVIFFLNGFLLRASYYSNYAKRLASWGYAVVQYDADRWPILTDRQELPFLASLTSWLRSHKDFQGVLDLSKVGIAGHSRGAKLAALQFSSGNNSIQAAFLVDPVDNTRETPESREYPSAAKALKLHGRPIGMCGASVISGCNPAGSNWKHFWPALAQDSWLLTVNGASHNSFLHASWLIDKALDLLCKRGSISHQDTIARTMPVMVAWMDKELRQTSQIEEKLQEQLLAWIKQQKASGNLDFQTKGIVGNVPRTMNKHKAEQNLGSSA